MPLMRKISVLTETNNYIFNKGEKKGLIGILVCIAFSEVISLQMKMDLYVLHLIFDHILRDLHWDDNNCPKKLGRSSHELRLSLRS